MGEKSQHYNSLVGRFHIAKEGIKEKWGSLKEKGKNIIMYNTPENATF